VVSSACRFLRRAQIAIRTLKTVREECLDRFVIFGKRHLRHLIAEFASHYMSERYHQGIGGQLISPNASTSNGAAPIGLDP
jgi:hypothetical protein